jgi:hypothetical protein
MHKFSINSSILTKIFFVIFASFLLAGYSWSSTTEAPVTAMFYDDNGTETARISAESGSLIYVPTAPDKLGHTFTHWQEIDGDETIARGVVNYVLTRDIMFEAQYTPIIHTVTFLDYDDTQVAQINATQGSQIDVPTASDRTGYALTQWKDVAGNETISSGVTTYTVTKDITFKAQYSPIIYTVTFLYDNNSVMEEINATFGASIQVPTPPAIPEYTFTGWLEMEGTERIEASATTYTVTRDITFKSMYNSIFYTAIFLNENNGVEANLSGPYGFYITVPNAPPKYDYTFTQWQEVGGSEAIPSGTAYYALTRDITFKAEYAEIIIEIRTQAELSDIRNNLSGKYRLMNDIALDENGAGYDSGGWLPIGDRSSQFIGTFDGNGHKITGLWIDRPTAEFVGLFGLVFDGAVIKNLGVEISSRGVKGKDWTGGIAGSIYGAAIINSYSTGSVSGNHDVGGIAGYMYRSSITNSYSTGSVSGNDEHIGGIVGGISISSIINSYSTASVAGTGTDPGTGMGVGGIVGSLFSNSTVINNAAINPSVGGVHNVNGIVGYIMQDGAITTSNNFALNTMIITGTPGYGSVGTPKTAVQLSTQSTYSNPIMGNGYGGLGWKFGNDDANPWKIDSEKNNGLPYLYWENR